MALNFRLFNCDRTFNLDKVEALIQRVAEKLSRETKIEKTYFPLPRMDELCKELEKEGSHFEYAVFVVHAHESRLSINEKNAGIGYAKVYRALQKVTDDRVLIVIGGDDNYKDQESDMSFLSRWAWYKICSQFTEDYVYGIKSFIFSWEENHHPIHEEALEFYLDPRKRGNKFVPRPKPKVPEKVDTRKTEQAKLLELKRQEPKPVDTRKLQLEKEFPLERNVNLSAKIPEKEDANNTEQAKLLELKRQEPKPVDTRKLLLEKKFPPERNKSRALPSGQETSTGGITDPLQRESQMMGSQTGEYQANQASAISGTPDVHILSFHASQRSVDHVVNVFEGVYKELAIASKPTLSADLRINIHDHIMAYKPEYLVLVSDLGYIEDMPRLGNQVQLYKDIVKESSSVGTKLIFIITEDQNYREGDMSSDVVHKIFTKLNQNIPSSAEQPTIMSWTKTPWSTHRDALKQFLSHYGGVRAAPQQYEATKQGPTSRVPYNQPVPMQRRFYRASVSYGRVVKVLSDPTGWEPDACDINRMLMEHGSVKKAIIEFWDEGHGLQSAFRPSEAKLCKITEGLSTDKMHSILVYSYHIEKETNEILSNLVHRVGVHVLSRCQPIKPASLMLDITCNKPGYVMLSADADILEDDGEVRTVIQEHGDKIRDIIDKCVGQGVIIMLFGDKYYKEGEFASDKATQYVRQLTQGIVEPGRLTVMTCKNTPYTPHWDWMKDILKSKGTRQSASGQGTSASVPASHYYKAVIKMGQITKVLDCNPPDWEPDKSPMVTKVLLENRNESKAYLEVMGNEQGEILSIAVEQESKREKVFSFAKKVITYPASLFSSDNKIEKPSADQNDFV